MEESGIVSVSFPAELNFNVVIGGVWHVWVMTHSAPISSTYLVSFQHVAIIVTFCFHSLLLGSSASLWLIEGMQSIIQLGIALSQAGEQHSFSYWKAV